MGLRETPFFRWPADPSAWRVLRLRVGDTPRGDPLPSAPRAGVLPCATSVVPWRSRDGFLELALVPAPPGQPTSAFRIELPAPLDVDPVLDHQASVAPGAVFLYIAPRSAIGRVLRVAVRFHNPPDNLDPHDLVAVSSIADLPSTVTALAHLSAGRVVAGMADGAAGVVRFGDTVSLTRFAVPTQDQAAGAAASAHADSARPRLLRRLTRSGAVTRSAAKDQHRDAIPTLDAVVVVDRGADNSSRVVLTVDRLGRIRLWSSSADFPDSFVLRWQESAGFVLYCDRASLVPSAQITTATTQKTVAGDSTSVFVAAMSDEEPRAAALNILKISVPSSGDLSTAALATVHRVEGPVEPVAAMVVQESTSSLLVAKSTGALNRMQVDLSSDARQAATPDLWTLVDELSDESRGGHKSVWSLIDSEFADWLDARLFAPNRFSDLVIARTLRRPDADLLSRQGLRAVAHDHVQAERTAGRSVEDSTARMVERATRLALVTDMTISSATPLVLPGVPWTTDSLVVVTRSSCVTVLRPCSAEEDLLLFGNPNPTGDTQDMDVDNEHTAQFSDLARSDPQPRMLLWSALSAATLQHVTAMLNGILDESLRSVSATTLFHAVQISESVPDSALVEVAVRYLQQRDTQLSPSESDTPEAWFLKLVAEVMTLLAPGASLLEFLYNLSETTLLMSVAASLDEHLPASARFARGRAALRLATETGRQQLLDKAKECLDLLSSGAQIVLEGTSEIDRSTIAVIASAPDGVTEIPELLHFWCRERIVRLMETAGAVESAADAAVEAMQCAPDRTNYEVMRSAAFNRFLEARTLDRALGVVLFDSFSGSDPSKQESEEEVSALRDAVSLLVVAAAEYGQLRWLMDYKLPSGEELPMRTKSLIAWSLQNRARLSDVSRDSGGHSGAYEDLIAWHLHRGDAGAAAEAALEWAERLENEVAAYGRFPPETWLKDRVRALTVASMALQEVPEHARWVSRQPQALQFGVDAELESDEGAVDETVLELVDVLDISDARIGATEVDRWLKLSAAQLSLVERFTHEGQSGRSLGPFDSTETGIDWCVLSLCSLEDFEMALDVALAWVERRNGSSLVRRVVHMMGSRAASMSDGELSSWSEAQTVLEKLERWRDEMPASHRGNQTRNFYVEFAESVLGGSGGRAALPQWLTNSAALHPRAYREGAGDGKALPKISRGQLEGTVRMLLRYGRPCDAAKMLLRVLDAVCRAREESALGNMSVVVPFAEVDATLTRLGQDRSKEAPKLRSQLRDAVSDHIQWAHAAR